MQHKVQNTRGLSSEELLNILCKSAKLYSEYADTTLLFIFREKKSDAYDFYEVRFGKNNFMHLAGIKSETLSANMFYKACLEGTITRDDCTPYNTEDITNIYQVNTLYPVYYVDKMPDMTNMLLQKTYPAYGFMEYLAIHKLKDWRYENEWRLIYDAGSWYFGPQDVPPDFWTQGKSVPFIRPARVIMGMEILEEHENKIREYAEIVGIPAIKATQTEYGLKID